MLQQTERQSPEKNRRPFVKRRGQSALEYMILTTVIVVVVLIGFDEKRGVLTVARNMAAGMFNQTIRGIWGTNSVVAARSSATDYP